MQVQIDESWVSVLNDEFNKSYFIKLAEFVKHEYTTQIIYPKGSNIFAAFNHCPFNKIKVVILGQDPYHGQGQAHGLCFSVPQGIDIPPSLRNIYKELNNDIGMAVPKTGNLTNWAKQGVFLLNATLTVRKDMAGSHQKKGWETFTDNVIKLISDKHNNIVFILWGAYAQQKEQLIDNTKHLILKSVHPSPLSASRGFFGNNHFSKTNNYLINNNKQPINWSTIN